MDQEHYQVELAVLLAEWRRRQAQLILRCWKLLTPAERRVMCRAILRCDESLAAPGRGKGAALRECFETIKPLTERASTRAKARQIAVFRRAGHRRARIRWPRHGDGARRVWCPGESADPDPDRPLSYADYWDGSDFRPGLYLRHPTNGRWCRVDSISHGDDLVTEGNA